MSGTDYRVSGAKDARYEQAHGVPVPLSEARARASTRREQALPGSVMEESADYWDGYADEVESWGHDLTDDDGLQETLELCICGQCFDCPDGWHRDDELPCLCTPDCVLGDPDLDPNMSEDDGDD